MIFLCKFVSVEKDFAHPQKTLLVVMPFRTCALYEQFCALVSQ